MEDPVPLYYRVEEQIKKRILDGQYEIGQPIPTETELQKEFGVSRLTIREAIKRLVAYRLVEKKQGRGTFVIRPDAHHRVGFLSSPSEEILSRNFTLLTKVIEIKKFNADELIAKNLSIQINEEVLFLERLRYANDVPAQLIKSYLPYKYVENIESVDFTKNFLYKILEDQYTLHLEEADEIIEAMKIGEKDANLLEIELGTPILLTKRKTYLNDGTIIEYNTILYRPNILKYHIKLKGRVQSHLLYRSIKGYSN